MNVGFIGLGKLGLPSALAIESKGHNVIGYDVNPNIKEYISKRKIPYRELGADELLQNTKIKILPLKEVLKQSEIIFVPVQTPHDPRYEGITALPTETADFDYSYLKSACESISKELDELNEDRTVIIISTVLPGTIEREIKPVLGKHVKLCYNPFFIAMGTTISDFLNPEIILFGVDDMGALDQAKTFYRTITNAPFHEMAIVNAELVKVNYNTYITMKINFANNLMEVCHAFRNLGANVDVVIDALSDCKRRIISPAYMRGGMPDSGGCTLPEQLIQTSSGLKQIKDISMDDMVLGHDGQFHKILNKFVRHYKGKMIKLTVSGSTKQPVILTPEHPVYAGRRKYHGSRFVKTIGKYDQYNRKSIRLGYSYGHEEFRDIPAQELHVGDYVYHSYKSNECIEVPAVQISSNNEPLLVLRMSLELMYVLGWFIAEGYAMGDGRVGFAFHKNERVYVESIKSTVEKLLCINVGIYEKPNSETLELRFTHHGFCNFLENTFGKYSYGKHIPISWLDLPDEYLRIFLRGMWYGDGSNSDKNRFFYTSVSRDIINFMHLALLRLNIPHTSKIRKKWVGKDGVNHRESYIIESTNIKQMNILLPDLKLPENKPRKSIWFEDNKMILSIKNIEELDYDGDVYNLNVAGVHTYSLENCFVTNCHPRDNIALADLAQKKNLSSDIYTEQMLIREQHIKWFKELIDETARKHGLPKAILGKSYKPETNLTVGSSSLRLYNEYRDHREDVAIWDPYVDGRDGVDRLKSKPHIFFIGTKHNDFKYFDFPRGSVVIDPFRYIPNSPHITLIPLGKSA